MDIISFSEAATANGRIEKFIKDPDSNSGIVTVPKVIGAGENITIPAGRVAVLPNIQVDGTLNVEGEVFIPSGATFVDLEDQIAERQLKSELAYNVDTSSYIPNTLASGAIIERGSNVNGEYVKFADGTLICSARLLNEVDYSWPVGTWFRKSNFPLAINGWTYPSAFSAVPNVYITSLNDAGFSGDIEGVLTGFYTTSPTKAFFDGKATANINRIWGIYVMAIGRWK